MLWRWIALKPRIILMNFQSYYKAVKKLLHFNCNFFPSFSSYISVLRNQGACMNSVFYSLTRSSLSPFAGLVLGVTAYNFAIMTFKQYLNCQSKTNLLFLMESCSLPNTMPGVYVFKYVWFLVFQTLQKWYRNKDSEKIRIDVNEIHSLFLSIIHQIICLGGSPSQP